jgi:hypothetical protein
MTLFEFVKMALRVTTTAYDDQINILISAALLDLGIAGILSTDQTDPLIMQAVATYCRLHFGSPADFDRLLAAYEIQKGQLQVATGYTKWVTDSDVAGGGADGS